MVHSGFTSVVNELPKVPYVW